MVDRDHDGGGVNDFRGGDRHRTEYLEHMPGHSVVAGVCTCKRDGQEELTTLHIYKRLP